MRRVYLDSIPTPREKGEGGESPPAQMILRSFLARNLDLNITLHNINYI